MDTRAACSGGSVDDTRFLMGELEEASFRSKQKAYMRRIREIELFLRDNPGEWGKFQSEFNREVNGIFGDVMRFERKLLDAEEWSKARKLRDIFVSRVRGLFRRGVYGVWSMDKPMGYAGDYKIIDDIYRNEPKTTGIDRLFDNYFQMSAISVAVRNRKEDFKRIIVDIIKKKPGCIRILDLASGPCRDVKEILSCGEFDPSRVTFDCYDNDPRALVFASSILKGFTNVNFYEFDMLKLAKARELKGLVDHRYDIIYATGIFDYFKKNVSTRVIRALRGALLPEGVMAASDVRDKYSNPSVHYMEWMGDWNLVYHEGDEFVEAFVEAGFKRENLDITYEQQGIMQYIIARELT